MKIGVLAGLFLLIGSTELKSQADSISYVSAPDSFPTFIYGREEFVYFFQHNLDYPMEALNKLVNGKVYLSFVVDTNHKIHNVTILKDLGYGCGEEAKRVIELTSGLWNAGYEKGKAVNVKMNFPIGFKCSGMPGTAGYRIPPDPQIIYERGLKELNADRLLTAIIYFTQALAINPSHVAALHDRGVARFKNNELKDACEDWNKALSLGDKNVSLLIGNNCK